MRFSWFFRVTREWCNKLLSPASNWVIDCMKKSQKTCVIIYFCGVTLLFRWLISRILAMALNCSVLYGSIFREVHHTFITAQFPSCTKNPPPNNTPWLMPPPMVHWWFCVRVPGCVLAPSQQLFAGAWVTPPGPLSSSLGGWCDCLCSHPLWALVLWELVLIMEAIVQNSFLTINFSPQL